MFSALWEHEPIKFIIVSGDNGNADYNKPADMKAELIQNKIPDSIIYLDFAGFRTLDAVLRARDIFGKLLLLLFPSNFTMSAQFIWQGHLVSTHLDLMPKMFRQTLGSEQNCGSILPGTRCFWTCFWAYNLSFRVEAEKPVIANKILRTHTFGMHRIKETDSLYLGRHKDKIKKRR